MRDKILDIAQELIQQRGINGMSYNDISKAVDIKKASIHYHFSSKEVLVNAILDRYLSGFRAEVEKILSSQVKSKTKLQKFMSLFSNTLIEGNNDKACLCGMLSAEFLSLTEDAANLVQEFLDESQKAIQQVLKEGLEDKSFQFNGDSKSMSELILSALEGGLFISRVSGGPEKFNKITRQIEKSITAK